MTSLRPILLLIFVKMTSFYVTLISFWHIYIILISLWHHFQSRWLGQLSWWWINFTYLFKPMMKIQIKRPKNPNCFKILPKSQSLEDSIFQMQNFMTFPVTWHFIRTYLLIICRCYPRGCCLNSKKIRIDEPKMEPSQSQKYCY